MSDDDNLSPDLEETLEEHIAWIKAVITDANRRGAPAITEAIADLEDGQLPGMLFCVLSAYVGDAARIRDGARDQIAREQFDQLDTRGSVTLH